MPFVFVWPKLGPVSPELARLAALLCPYRGDIARVELGRGQLYVSSIAELTPAGVAIPARTKHNAQTAWLEIRIGDGDVRFETDPLGTFPLWIAEGDAFVGITGEVKSLRAFGFAPRFEPERWPANRKRPPDYSPYANVRRAMPGSVLHVSNDGTLHEEVRRPLVYQATALPASDQETTLDAALLGSARAIADAGVDWGAFLSGGIDSSLATTLLKRSHTPLRTYTLGTEYGDEYADAEALAASAGTLHTRVFATGDDAKSHFERAVFCNETIDGLTAETLAQLSILAKTAAAPDVRRVVTGYGADLLFGSMLRHELYMKVTGVEDLQSLIERTCWSGEFAPFYAWSLGLEVHHLFWDPAVMNCAFRIPPEASYDGVHEKVLLRTLAVQRGYLNAAHAFRRKQALTDGTQFNRLLSRSLQLDEPYAYDDKSARAVSVLRHVLQTA